MSRANGIECDPLRVNRAGSTLESDEYERRQTEL